MLQCCLDFVVDMDWV